MIATLLKEFISYTSSMVEFLGPFMCTVILRAKMISFLSVYIPLTSFCCLIALLRMSRTKPNGYGESGQSCLVPDFGGIILNSHSFN